MIGKLLNEIIDSEVRYLFTILETDQLLSICLCNLPTWRSDYEVVALAVSTGFCLSHLFELLLLVSNY